MSGCGCSGWLLVALRGRDRAFLYGEENTHGILPRIANSKRLCRDNSPTAYSPGSGRGSFPVGYGHAVQQLRMSLLCVIYFFACHFSDGALIRGAPVPYCPSVG